MHTKTQLARAIAGEAQAAFMTVGPSDVLSKYVGESEASIRDLFKKGETTTCTSCFISICFASIASNPRSKPLDLPSELKVGVPCFSLMRLTHSGNQEAEKKIVALLAAVVQTDHRAASWRNSSFS